MKKQLFFLVIFLSFVNVNSQERDFQYTIQLNAGVATGKKLPFWMTANQFGAIPSNNYGVVYTSLGYFPEYKSDKVSISYKAAFSGGNDLYKNNLLINELFARLQYNSWQLDLGVKHQEIDWEGLSSSNGNIAMATNARSLPGYNLRLANFVGLPFAKKWLTIKGNYSDYLLNDTRMVSNARLHTKSIYFKSKLSPTFEIITGLNHYAQWAGTSSIYGKQPIGFKNYLRVISGSSGGSDATGGDQINVIGNQLGSYVLQFNYIGEKTNWNLYWSHPFEDRSGRELMNYPDGLYGFFMDFKKPKAAISHMLAEITYTKHASGDDPHYSDEFGYHAGSGMDNYFNNGVYQSGWTYFGKMIGSPYFTTKPIDENGITQGIIDGDNRLLAFNIGLKGTIQKIPYKVVISHVTYFGWFGSEYSKKPIQTSGLLEIKFPNRNTLPFKISLGAAFDTGTYSQVNFGGFLKLTKSGIF